MDKSFLKNILIFVLLAEALSFLAFYYPNINVWIFGLVSLIVIALSVYKLEWGIMIAFAELVIGSLGKIFFLEIGTFDLSIRMIIWLAVMAAWAVRAWQQKRVGFIHSKLFKPYLALATVLGWGIIWGVIRGNPLGAVFSDANNYLFFLLIFPVYHVFGSDRDAMYRVSTAVVMAAFAWLSIKTIALFYIFSHEFFGLQDILYGWSRHAHLAEITNIDPNVILSRVFMQSQIWLVFGVFVLLSVILSGVTCRIRRGTESKDLVEQETSEPDSRDSSLHFVSFRMTWIVALLILSLSAIIASFSRSFWLAIAVTTIVFLAALIFGLREKLKHVGKFIAVSAGVVVLAIGFTIGVMQFPIPPGTADANLIRSRAGKFTGEAAVSSRYAQIRPLLESIKNHPVWGAGFGTSVTYQSQDPRVLKNNPDGWYTTTAFELGWLEMWLKIGLLGVVIYLYLLWQIVKVGYRQIGRHLERTRRLGGEVEGSRGYLILGAITGLAALAVIHAASPYLNHPLGIGIVILATVLISHES